MARDGKRSAHRRRIGSYRASPTKLDQDANTCLRPGLVADSVGLGAGDVDAERQAVIAYDIAWK